jgi:hypothetical protein
MKTELILIFAGPLLLAACDGPHEEAGERLDAQRGATGGTGSIVSGPAERAGERQDQLDKQRREANAAAADRQ